MGMFYSHVHIRACQLRGYFWAFYHKHIGVGFCVARFDKVGNAKASIRGTSNRYRLPRFFVYVPKQTKQTGLPGSLKAYQTFCYL